MKHCIIVHGCPSDGSDPSYNKHRMPWVSNNLEGLGYVVDTPLMPKPWMPVYDDYKTVFETLTVTEESILVGHSCGCAFLVRWLSENPVTIKQLILVAPWKINAEGDEYREAFYTFEIDKSLQNRIGNIIMFTADNEDSDGKLSLEMYQEVLGGTVHSISGYGHYTLGCMGTEQFPELIEVVVEDGWYEH